MMVIFKRKNSRCSIHHETSQGAPVYWHANMLHAYYHVNKAIKLHVLQMPLLFDDFNDAVRHFGIQKITAMAKTDSQDFSQRNPRDQNGEIHRVLRGLETWPRLKGQQNSTSESGWRSGISGDSVGEWEIDLNRVILWNLQKRSKTKTKGWQKQRDMIPLAYKTITN